MSEIKQTELFSDKPERIPRVVFTPPSEEIIDRYAFDVCQAYKSKNDFKEVDTEFIQGFKAFVRSIVKAQTNIQNRGKKL